MSQSASRNHRSLVEVLPTARRGAGYEDVVYKSQGAEDIANILNALKGDSHYVLLTNRIQRFFEETESVFQRIDVAVAERDYAQLEQVVDDLRQETSVMGAVAMMKLCYQLQILARTKSQPEILDRLDALKQEFDQVKQGLVREG